MVDTKEKEEEHKIVSLDGIKISVEGKKLVFACIRKAPGEPTPCDLLAGLMAGTKEVIFKSELEEEKETKPDEHHAKSKNREKEEETKEEKS